MSSFRLYLIDNSIKCIAFSTSTSKDNIKYTYNTIRRCLSSNGTTNFFFTFGRNIRRTIFQSLDKAYDDFNFILNVLSDDGTIDLIEQMDKDSILHFRSISGDATSLSRLSKHGKSNKLYYNIGGCIAIDPTISDIGGAIILNPQWLYDNSLFLSSYIYINVPFDYYFKLFENSDKYKCLLPIKNCPYHAWMKYHELFIGRFFEDNPLRLQNLLDMIRYIISIGIFRGYNCNNKEYFFIILTDDGIVLFNKTYCRLHKSFHFAGENIVLSNNINIAFDNNNTFNSVKYCLVKNIFKP